MINHFDKNIDNVYFYLTLVLIGIGFVIQYSASSGLGMANFQDSAFYMKAHLIRIVIGAVCGIFFVLVDYHYLKKYALAIVGLLIAALVATLAYNGITHAHSTARWLSLGFMEIQTSEFAKLALIIYLAAYIEKNTKRLDDWKEGFMPPAVILTVIVGLVVIEPDFSSGMLILFLGLLVMWIGGAKITHILGYLGAMAPLGVIVVLQSPYKLKRILTYFNKSSDAGNDAYQITQSLITLGNGGFSGRGIGGSVEKNLFLPEPHTDFIFSVAGEEFGFIGAVAIMSLFLVLFIRGIRISMGSPNLFGKLLGVGISISMFFNVIFNIGVVCGIFPVTGLPLPFISYGGSSMLFNFVCIGIILNISKKSVIKPIRI